MDGSEPGMDALHPITQEWFRSAFPAPTPAQAGAWSAIASGQDTLVVAPTGSGKTLAAFLQALDRLLHEPPPEDPGGRCRVLYVSPLKALAMDVERNLRSPLVGIQREAARAGSSVSEVTVGIRTGDTPAAERSRMARRPPDILITTPESLFLLLTSQARETLRQVDTVIIDEVHAVAGTKRGAHLALSLERLDELREVPAQRIGLSATVRPVEEVARYLRPSHPATVVAPPTAKAWDLQIRVPVEDMAAPGDSASSDDPVARSSIWPHIDDQLVDLIAQHRATLVFANSRRLAERITARINEIAAERAAADGLREPQPIARAHHGSVSREQRALIEEDLKSGRLPAVVATSSLELGIDMGAIDLVVQVETPPSVASGLQRVGRAGHQVGAVSKGVLFPKYRGDLLTSAVVTQRMREGDIEHLRIPRSPLDVLAQQIVAMVAMDDWTVRDLRAVVTRAAPFTELSESILDSVLDMLSGRYPSDEFAELRPRLVWDRDADLLTGRPGAQRLAVTSGGTIPDRGLFGVFLVGAEGPGARVGELDEEMVYESRVGDVIALGASSWRIEDITHDRVLVTPAPGHAGRLPFWHGDALGRPAELGRAVGSFVRGLATAKDGAARLRDLGLDERAVDKLLRYVDEQRAATGLVPSDTTVVVERFRDELGDWRVVVHTPFGAQVHAPWALVLGARLRDALGVDAQVMHADDGIVLRLPDSDDEEVARAVIDLIAAHPDEVEAEVTAEVGGSALFAARFRECAARALLLPRRRPDRRTPLWQQRQRSAQLLGVAADSGSFPIVLETLRECLQDVYDVPALREVLAGIQSGAIRVHEAASATPSPFAQSLLFGYVASFLYEGDSPLAERRAQALTVDPALLAELLGTPELRDLLDPQAIDEVEAELQRLTPATAARSLEEAADLLRLLGPLTEEAAEARGVSPAWLAGLVGARRAIVIRLPGGEATAAIEDAGRLRDALGVPLPVGLPEAHLAVVDDPLGDVVGRFARTHGPFRVEDAASALGLPVAVVAEVLGRLVAGKRVVQGEFRPDGTGSEYCDADVLRRIRRRSVARLRHQIEPVPQQDFGAFLPAWQHVAASGARPELRGVDGCFEVVDQLAGAALPASTWLQSVLPVRVDGFEDGSFDQLLASGDVVWWGVSPLPGTDGVLALAPVDRADYLRPKPDDSAVGDEGRLVLEALRTGGAQFFRDLADRVGVGQADVPLRTDAELVEALWALVWSGHVTNDGWSALRARLSGRPPRRHAGTRRGRVSLPSRSGPPAAAGRWALLPPVPEDATGRATAVGQALLERYGIITRGSVVGERVDGGFAALARVLTAFEDVGRCQRTYAVEGLGASQFALPAAVDRVRVVRRHHDAAPQGCVVLAATDPAQPYGAALPWPDLPSEVGSHRPGRKAGAFVVLAGGAPCLYLEKGGRSLLVWESEPDILGAATEALSRNAGRLGLDRVVIQRVNGAPALEATSLAQLPGLLPTPRGLRLRAG